MNILIIGCRGQLGTDCAHLLTPKHDLTCCDTPQIDIGNEQHVSDCMENVRPQVIINCAAYTAVDKCETERDLCWDINAHGPKYLAQAADKLGSRLIHISTDYVFDGKKQPPAGYTEDEATTPLSQYGQAKLAGERAVQAHCEDHLILRTAWLYSAWGSNFLKTMLRLARQAPDRELKVVNDQHGSLTWSLTLARQIERLLETDMRGIVHATAEGHSTWYEGASYFLDAMGVRYAMRPCTTQEYPTPAARPANSILDNTRLNEAGLSVFHDWQEDIDLFIGKHKEQLLQECR